MPSVQREFCDRAKLLPVGDRHLLKFKMSGTASFWSQATYKVTMQSSNSHVRLSTKSVEVEEGWRFLTYIESSRPAVTTVDLKVAGGPSQQFKFQFQANKDVFDQVAHQRLVDEFKYIKPFADSKHPAEYAGNYCMQAAERGLSELLNDDRNFYAVNRSTHSRKNSISMSGKTGMDRGQAIYSRGLTEAPHRFRGFGINHKKKDQIYNSTSDANADQNYQIVKYDIIELTAFERARLTKFITDDIDKREIGFHVYYVTVTDGFHTLVLVVDTYTDPCKPTYQMWDQHGATSSHGALTDVAEGVRRQASWTFANSCLNRYKTGRTSQWDSTEAKLWKVKVR